ncbi:hypothetical protein [Anatilimnocola floriformis]|uniref:hypothetical protein n=1 Tax=Anatilimnocola floriformis TaxID=2948575 RepID=UPI0020C2D597|nr:hypothetical protein [Anatilimnocola floriformis]
MRTYLALFIVIAGLTTLAGCGGQTAAQSHVEPAQGQVDTSLTPYQQSQQRGLLLFLNAVQEGATDPQSLSLLAPVDFRDSFPTFFGAQQRLLRWNFNGTPQGNEVPVTLILDNQASGVADPANEVRESRIYYVIPAGQRFTIARKS